MEVKSVLNTLDREMWGEGGMGNSLQPVEEKREDQSNIEIGSFHE